MVSPTTNSRKVLNQKANSNISFRNKYVKQAKLDYRTSQNNSPTNGSALKHKKDPYKTKVAPSLSVGNPSGQSQIYLSKKSVKKVGVNAQPENLYIQSGLKVQSNFSFSLKNAVMINKSSKMPSHRKKITDSTLSLLQRQQQSNSHILEDMMIEMRSGANYNQVEANIGPP